MDTETVRECAGGSRWGFLDRDKISANRYIDGRVASTVRPIKSGSGCGDYGGWIANIDEIVAIAPGLEQNARQLRRKRIDAYHVGGDLHLSKLTSENT